MKGDVIKKVKEKLTEHGFTLPGNVQELKLYDKTHSIPVTVLNRDNSQH